MLTIACVLKSGGIYDATWVARLRDGVARHLPLEHCFVSLSDVEVPCERIPLEHGWPGWWSKIELFRLQGPVLYFDLDTAIVGDLRDIAARTDPDYGFTILRDFYRLGDGLGSGVMAWSNDFKVSPLYSFFREHAAHVMQAASAGGDQLYIERRLSTAPLDRWQDVVPGQIASYKVHCRSGIPPDARVVCLHGRPKFADMPVSDPVRQAWEMAA